MPSRIFSVFRFSRSKRWRLNKVLLAVFTTCGPSSRNRMPSFPPANPRNCGPEWAAPRCAGRMLSKSIVTVTGFSGFFLSFSFSFGGVRPSHCWSRQNSSSETRMASPSCPFGLAVARLVAGFRDFLRLFVVALRGDGRGQVRAEHDGIDAVSHRTREAGHVAVAGGQAEIGAGGKVRDTCRS